MKKHLRSGFTLIELVLVIAILGIISTIAVTKFGDLKKKSARKVNVTNMQQLSRAVETYLAITDVRTGMFNHFDSLIDLDESGKPWLGSPGQFQWRTRGVTGDNYLDVPGIYNGIKLAQEVANAGGVVSGTPALTEAREDNRGMNTTLMGMLDIYFLTEAEAGYFKNAGISTYLLHNPSSAQAGTFSGVKTHTPDEKLAIVNGGPGHRPDMSAFYPKQLEAGSPVVIINPAKLTANARSSNGLTVYKQLNLDPELTEDELDLTGAEYFGGWTGTDSNGDSIDNAAPITTKLFCFGIGRSSKFVQAMLDTPPYSEVLGKEFYRNYIIVFSLSSGGNSGGVLKFAGILDPEGNALAQARYQALWAGN